MNRWSQSGVLDRVFAALQEEQILRVNLEVVALDSTSVKVHPDGTGGTPKEALQAIGKSLGGWNTKVHLVAADDRRAVYLRALPWETHDGPEGRILLCSLGPQPSGPALLMDRAYEGDATRQLAMDLGYQPVVPPLSSRKQPWEYDRELYKRRTKLSGCFAD